ncbi:5-methylthioadenosine/S-adenosylhomocysteine deaminase [Thermoactinomyces sp. DSM 45891]|uniref:amidohydrolase family protein n=1 Tax=Thermoactinomyces sp. DSM 45891 TaxID=1761907 RepID=UPI00091DC21F|nr:amidohydrolase family protein [Thermoactinomyces sp. DSM 45891]SFX57060.1 5-methylthioadenosine/S-adenosylhomocysteine deaminase [Thermoactinomyces sp. DSM 45891]
MGISMEPNKGMDRITLKNATYYSDQHDFRLADIVIYGNKIEKICQPNSQSSDHVIDAKSLIVLPGLTNGHLHPSKELYGGVKAFSSISEVLDTVHRNNHLETEELQGLSSLYSILHSLRQGITTLGIFTSRAEIDAEQAKKAGVRAVIHFSQNDQWLGRESKPSSSSLEEVIKRYSDCVHTYESDLIKVHPATASELSATPELMKELHKIAFQENKKFVMHICEGKSQVEQCISHYGKSGIQVLDKLHLLDSSTLLVHASTLSDEDLHVLSDKKVNFIHCPVSNSFTGAGRFPFKALIHNKIGLGTDAAMVNPFHKLAFDAAFSLYFHGESNLEEKVDVTDIVDSITKTGASALGLDHVGSVKEGMFADLCFFKRGDVVVESQDPSLLFLDVILSHHPIHVMVNGEFVILNESFLHCDFNLVSDHFLQNKKWGR